MTEVREPTFLVLVALAEGPRHGYGLIQGVEKLSNGKTRLRGDSVCHSRPSHLRRAHRTRGRRGRRGTPEALLPLDGERKCSARDRVEAAPCGRERSPAQASCLGSQATSIGRWSCVKARGDRFTQLLRAYPKAYRDRRGDEIASTLLEDASDNGTYESIRVGIDIVAHGLRLRAGIASDQLAGRVLVAAALPGMMTAAAAAAIMPMFGQVFPDIRYGPSSWGPDTAIWPAALHHLDPRVRRGADLPKTRAIFRSGLCGRHSDREVASPDRAVGLAPQLLVARLPGSSVPPRTKNITPPIASGTCLVGRGSRPRHTHGRCRLQSLGLVRRAGLLRGVQSLCPIRRWCGDRLLGHPLGGSKIGARVSAGPSSHSVAAGVRCRSRAARPLHDHFRARARCDGCHQCRVGRLVVLGPLEGTRETFVDRRFPVMSGTGKAITLGCDR